MTSVVRTSSTAVGLLMVTSATVGAHGPALVAATLAVVAVVAGAVFRPAATLAVLLTVVTIVVSNPSPMLAALSGLSAAAYLVLRYAVRTPTGVVTAPTMIGAVGFSFVGLVAASFPLQLPWLPLLAPLVVVAIFTLATRPFLG
ncbi:MAG TPA: hypothetical protein VEF72_32410 [Mycobacterium sp.]|nr:hypothetical protein [Mycobacterium sp.]